MEADQLLLFWQLYYYFYIYIFLPQCCFIFIYIRLHTYIHKPEMVLLTIVKLCVSPDAVSKASIWLLVLSEG